MTTSRYDLSKKKHELTHEQGKFLVKLARSALEHHFSGKQMKKPDGYDRIFNELRGVFVTLTKHKNLRGCIGYSEPIEPLIDAVMECAVHAALNDPRFPPVEKSELKDLKIEITILTPPKLIKVNSSSQYGHIIILGRDGLIVENGRDKGLLLPQVPQEWGWNETEFLEHTCEKAGLPMDAWKDIKFTKIYKFQGQIFHE